MWTLTVGSGPSAQTVGPLSVALTAALAGGVGWALLALLGGQLRDGRRTWRIIAGLVLAVSLLGPVSMGAAGAVLVSLIAMHLAVGGTLIPGTHCVRQARKRHCRRSPRPHLIRPDSRPRAG